MKELGFFGMIRRYWIMFLCTIPMMLGIYMYPLLTIIPSFIVLFSHVYNVHNGRALEYRKDVVFIGGISIFQALLILEISTLGAITFAGSIAFLLYSVTR